MEKPIFYHSSCNILVHSDGTTYVTESYGIWIFHEEHDFKLQIEWWIDSPAWMLKWIICPRRNVEYFSTVLNSFSPISWVKTKMLWVINGNSNVCFARRTHLFTKTGFWSKIQCWMNFTQLCSNLNEFEWNENVCATAFICIWIVCRYRCCCCCHTYSLSWFSYLYFVRCTCVCWCIER